MSINLFLIPSCLDRFFHLLWNNPFRLFAIVLKRLSYFKKLITKFKILKKESTEIVEESLIYDYLQKIKQKDSDVNHFSGNHFRNLMYNDIFIISYIESQLLWLISDLFIAGGETTITTIRWLLLCLATFPDIQERLRDEISETFGKDSSPTYIIIN